MNIYSLYELSKEFAIFAILAAIRTYLVDILLWQILISYLEKVNWDNVITKRLRLNVYSFAHIITFILSSTLSYLLNRFLTFNQTNVLNELYSILAFFGVNIITLVLSTIILNYLTNVDTNNKYISKYGLIKKNWVVIAKLFTIVITMIINYLAYKLFIFS
jgi:putative flippase GtrA